MLIFCRMEQKHRCPVTLGISDQNGNVEIASGVTADEQVINIGLKNAVMADRMIDVKDLKKDYIDEGEITSALRGVSFTINKGDFVSIMGPVGFRQIHARADIEFSRSFDRRQLYVFRKEDR